LCCIFAAQFFFYTTNGLLKTTMKLITSALFGIACAFAFPAFSQAQVLVNEVMASNNATITDPDYGESSDWVELYNAGSSDVDLGGYYITDNLNTPDKYQLPNGTVIKAGGYLLIWCDGNATGLHTGFKLSADGESVGLYNPSLEPVDAMSFDVQLLDISYGRRQDDPNEWAYFATATPGAANGYDCYTGKSNQPMILTRGGFISGSVTVPITNDLGGDVHYTLDGSVPTTSSPIYTEPLTFTSTTVLRARIIEEGKIPGNVVTESYFIDEAFAGHGLPVVSIVTDNDNFWGTDGIYTQDFKPDWEVPVNIEMFLNNGSDRSVFNESAGIKINGLYSWQLPQKMLGVYFKKKYGESKLEYKLFVDDKRDSFDDFALRASGSDWSYTLMRDGLVHQASRKGNMNLDLMAFRPCVVYVNGEFLGVHNIREKVNSDYIKQHYGLSASTYDMVEGGDTPEVGVADNWIDFFDKVQSANLADDATFAEMANEMDVENFTDYIIAEAYSTNWSLDHNTMVWKTHEGGKWRWILMDTDRGFFKFDTSSYPLSFFVNQSIWPLKWMLKNANYKNYFCQRMADQLFTTYNPDEVCRQIYGHEEAIAPLMDQQIARWKGTTSSYGDAIASVAKWRNNVEALRDFAHGRVSLILNELSNYGAQKPALLTLSSEPADVCTWNFNGHDIDRTLWGGLYPKQMDITLSAQHKAGYSFAGWKETTLTNLIAKGDTWSYNDSGSNLGTAWIANDYDDSSWSTGAAPLGYSYSDIKTTISKRLTNYFRKHFNVDKSGNIKNIKMQLRREDAALVYINGKQVINSNLPVDGVTSSTSSYQTMSSVSGQIYLTYTIDPDDLVDGDNVIAVEIHQSSASSSDLGFDVELQMETLDADAPILSSDKEITFQLDGNKGVCAVYESTGENIVPANIDNDLTLYKSKSPYIVPQNVVVGSDARLTIEPGVTLLFSPGVNMIVNGAVTAEGTAEDSIMFRLNPAFDENESWGALCFINTDDRVSNISYTEFRDGSKGPSEYNCVAVVSGFKTTLRLDHLRITDTDANPIACRYSDLRLTNSLLHSSITGDLTNVKYGKGYVADCEFIGNDQVDTDAIDYDGVTDGVIKRVVIHDFLGNNSDAIDIGEQAPGVSIDSILVYNITDKGVSVGQRSSAYVSNSTFIQTNLGLGIKDSCYVDVDRCTFYAVCTPIACYEKVLGRAGGNANVTGCVFANSFVEDVLCDEKSKVVIRRSLSDTSELPYGEDNTLADPQFAAPSLYDLSSASPLLEDCGSDYMPKRPAVQPVITELCYLPDVANGETEYLVLSNVGSEDLDLAGYTFSKGLTFTFTEGVILSAGESLYIVKELGAMATEYDQHQWTSGKLADEGEAIELSAPTGIIVDQVNYSPSAPWPVLSSEGENAIVLKDYLKANHLGANWQQKPSAVIDDIADILRDNASSPAYDLHGRRVYVKTSRGLFIINGQKVIK